METYIGTKIVRAEPMSAEVFAATIRPLPSAVSEHMSPSGPLAGYKVVYDDGYVSWSPRDVFERCYRLITDTEKALL